MWVMMAHPRSTSLFNFVSSGMMIDKKGLLLGSLFVFFTLLHCSSWYEAQGGWPAFCTPLHGCECAGTHLICEDLHASYERTLQVAVACMLARNPI